MGSEMCIRDREVLLNASSCHDQIPGNPQANNVFAPPSYPMHLAMYLAGVTDLASMLDLCLVYIVYFPR